MKKVFTLIIMLTMVATVSFAQADPAVGFWLSIDENTNEVTAGWQIFTTNNELRGRIVSLPNDPRGSIATEMNESYRGFPLSGRVNRMEIAGPPWIFGLTRRAEGDWRGGNIIDPSDGRMWGCRITFRPVGSRIDGRTTTVDMLEVRGTFGPFGRSQYWRRTDQETASNLWPE